MTSDGPKSSKCSQIESRKIHLISKSNVPPPPILLSSHPLSQTNQSSTLRYLFELGGNACVECLEFTLSCFVLFPSSLLTKEIVPKQSYINLHLQDLIISLSLSLSLSAYMCVYLSFAQLRSRGKTQGFRRERERRKRKKKKKKKKKKQKVKGV